MRQVQNVSHNVIFCGTGLPEDVTTEFSRTEFEAEINQITTRQLELIDKPINKAVRTAVDKINCHSEIIRAKIKLTQQIKGNSRLRSTSLTHRRERLFK